MAQSAMHTRKKQYQAPITSFFSAGASHQTPAPRLAPTVPEETQAGLISVGMRIRKSVPEGYKTHKTLGVAALPFTSSALALKTITPQNVHTSVSPGLMPFCGLHKVGGWAMQPPSSAPELLESQHDEDDEYMPGLSLSQATIASTQETLQTNIAQQMSGNKRTYEDDVEDNLDAFFGHSSDIDDDNLPITNTTRPIAKVRSARKNEKPSHTRMASGVDFEDATFLTPMDGIENVF